MSDFITLSCPTCGGHMQLESTTREYTCDYCGQRHIVRNEDIEFYGRCPICKRNDRVEKVSAIYQNEADSSSLVSRIKPPIEPIIDGKKGIYLTKTLQLKIPNIRVVEDVQPDNYSIAGYVLLLFISFFFVVWLLATNKDTPTCISILCVGIVISILMIRHGKKRKS